MWRRILRIFFLLHWSQQSFFHPSLKIKKAFLCIIVFYFVDTAVSSILCSRLLVIQTAFGSLLGDKQLIFMRNIWVFSKYCVCVVVPEKKFSRILEDEGWKNCADFFVGMNAATSLQTSRVCCREKDFYIIFSCAHGFSDGDAGFQEWSWGDFRELQVHDLFLVYSHNGFHSLA